jgi:hypothetical protein
MSSVSYLLNRVHTHPITNETKGTEVNIISNILRNNKYSNIKTKAPSLPRKQNTKMTLNNKNGLPLHTGKRKSEKLQNSSKTEA